MNSITVSMALCLIIAIVITLCFLLKPKCPDCGGIMDYELHDMTIDKPVYKCRKCGKEWV